MEPLAQMGDHGYPLAQMGDHVYLLAQRGDHVHQAKSKRSNQHSHPLGRFGSELYRGDQNLCEQRSNHLITSLNALGMMKGKGKYSKGSIKPRTFVSGQNLIRNMTMKVLQTPAPSSVMPAQTGWPTGLFAPTTDKELGSTLARWFPWGMEPELTSRNKQLMPLQGKYPLSSVSKLSLVFLCQGSNTLDF